MIMKVSGIWRINLLLAVFSILFVSFAVVILLKSPEGLPSADKNERQYNVLPSVVPAKRSMRASDYDELTSKNILSPDRTYIPPEKVSTEPEKKEEIQELPDKEVILYGTMVSGDFSFAIISNPGIEGNDHPQVKVKAGDHAGNYLIKGIKALSITVQKGGQDFVIPINKSKASDVAKNSAKFSAPPEPKSLIKQIGSRTSGPDKSSRGNAADTDKKISAVKADKPETKEAVKKEVVKDNTPPKPVAPLSEASKPKDTNPAPSADEEKYEIINTPFGQTKRKVK